MVSTLRWGVLGTARIARERMLPILQSTPRSTVVAIASREKDRAEQVARDFGIPRHYGDYDELLADPEIDAVYIPLPPSLHVEWTLKAIAAGKAVLTEKPLATTESEAAAIVGASNERGLLVAEALQYRHHPRFRALLDLIESGELGAVQLVRASFGYRATEKHRVRLDPTLGGGAILDLGCYLLDSLRLVLRNARAVEAQGVVTRAPSGVDDLAAAVVRYSGGRVGLIDCSLRLPWRFAPLEVVGERRSARLVQAFNPGEQPSTIELLAESGDIQALDFAGIDPQRVMVRDFVAAILEGQPFPFPIDGSINTLAAIDLLRGLPMRAR
ncbi:MAG TPA: Gfo/Idh/MocA family oxidoreductase [Thermomicrobiaceae bacterium]|nr:Gfo/Idh/MocA family oxidoreductase [Thermomicrobiaceae bacterium]